MKRLLTILAGVTLLAISYHASAATIIEVGGYDDVIGQTTLTNSGGEEVWVESVLTNLNGGVAVDINYTQLTEAESGGEQGNWESVTGVGTVDGDYAFDLELYNPAYFLVKVGGGNGTNTVDTHYLFDNEVEMNWAFLNLSVFGEGVSLDNIGVVSHVGVTSPVPIPAAVWLFGSGLIGLVAVGRRKV